MKCLLRQLVSDGYQIAVRRVHDRKAIELTVKPPGGEADSYLLPAEPTALGDFDWMLDAFPADT